VSTEQAFKALERAGWGARADTYGLLTGRVTDRMAERLLDAAGVVAGRRVLDVGTGPGYAAGRAAERGALTTGVDMSGEMVALARRRSSEVRFLQADADELPFPDSSFDALVGNFVINHLPTPERAIREFVRVLAPGGEIALSTWDLPEHNRILGILLDALRDCGVGEAAPGPDPFRFADDEELRGLLRGGGLEAVEVRQASLSHRVGGADQLWEGMLGGSVRTAGLVLKQPPETRARIRATAERLAEVYRAGGELVIPVSARIGHGRTA